MPGSKRKVVADAKDLKPLRVRLFRCTRWISSRPGTGGRREWRWVHWRTNVGRGRPRPALPGPGTTTAPARRAARSARGGRRELSGGAPPSADGGGASRARPARPAERQHGRGRVRAPAGPPASRAAAVDVASRAGRRCRRPGHAPRRRCRRCWSCPAVATPFLLRWAAPVGVPHLREPAGDVAVLLDVARVADVDAAAGRPRSSPGRRCRSGGSRTSAPSRTPCAARRRPHRGPPG